MEKTSLNSSVVYATYVYIYIYITIHSEYGYTHMHALHKLTEVTG